jgi:phosphoribosyl 1,2-cyclic phosphodiesterase
MLKFISFGSGSDGNCYFLYTEKDGMLIDTGVGLRKLKNYFNDNKLSLGMVKRVLITHDHADHINSVGSFSKKYNVPVYTTQEVHAGILKNYSVVEKLSSEHTKYLVKGETCTLGDFTITPFKVPHDSSDNVGYKVECEGVIFCLMTDAGYVTDEMKQYISCANYLVIEANHDASMLRDGHYSQFLKERIAGEGGHLSNSDAAQALVENATQNLRHVWLCHLSNENNHPELARKTVETILKDNGIVVGADFMLDVLPRTKPTDIFELK